MAFSYKFFGLNILPELNTEHEVSTGEVDSSLIKTVNGRAVNYLGSTRRLPSIQTFSLEGYLIEEINTIGDESSNLLVDESGSFLIASEEGAYLRTQVQTLRRQVGVWGQLYINDWYTADLKYKWCRLMKVGQTSTYKEKRQVALLRLLFETKSATWKTTTKTVTTKSLVLGANVFQVENDGEEDVRDGILTFTATGSTVGSISFRLGNADWSWSGSLPVGSALVFDSGKMTVKLSGQGDYNGLTYSTAHIEDALFRIVPGPNVASISTDQACDIKMEHFDQWM
ncbi:MAG: hypothetical protein AAF702_32930 [Chloroflexota bacterium]